MVKLTAHMKQILKQQPVVFVATKDGLGLPDISPKAAVKIIDDDKLVCVGVCSLQTWVDLRDRPSVAVAAVVPQTYEGYQFKGWAELVDEGPLFEEIAGLLVQSRSGPQPMELWFEKAARELTTAMARTARQAAQPCYTVVIHIEEVWNLTPGHEVEVWR